MQRVSTNAVCRASTDGCAILAARPLVLIVAGISKAIFIALVLSQGTRYLAHQAGLAAAVDLVMVLLFAWCLLAIRGVKPGS